MRRRRQTQGFNLAFLDIMSCGLGAIVLVFMMVKHNVSESPAQEMTIGEDVRRLEAERAALEGENTTLEQALVAGQTERSALESEIRKLEQKLNETQGQITSQSQNLSDLKKAIQDAPPLETDDVIETTPGGEETYLMGLRVEGRRIALLVDRSASMSDEKLIDVIRRKTGSAAEKKAAPKWQRTQRVVQWLLARLPRHAEVGLIAFHDKAEILKGGMGRADNATHLSGLIQSFGALTPSGATNLQLALIKAQSLKADHLYIVTDGLPTVGESRYGSLNPFSDCSSLLGRGSTISGACRVKLFRQTLKDSEPTGVKVSVILLPLEGDPEAANEYWSWTARTGGLLISPAKDWP